MMKARLQLEPIEVSQVYDWDAEIADLIAEIREDERTGAADLCGADRILYRALTENRAESPKGPWVH